MSSAAAEIATTLPEFTLSTYFNLIGGPLPSRNAPVFSIISSENITEPNGSRYVREHINLRILSDESAHTEHPELMVYKEAIDKGNTVRALTADSNLTETDKSKLDAFYRAAVLLSENMTYGNDPVGPKDLADIQAAMRKFSPDQLLQHISSLYEQTLKFYKYTEAYVLKPDNVANDHKYPAIFVAHQHNAEYEIGKSEPVGLAGNPEQAMALDFVRKGFIAITYDQLGFETRKHPVRTGLQFERWRFGGLMMEGKTLLRNYLSDAEHVLDYLAARSDVNTNKIGAYGHSLGAWVVANLAQIDQRIKATVVNAGFPTIKGMNAYGGQYHCEPHFIPGLHLYGDTPVILGVRCAKILMNFGGQDVLNTENNMVIDNARRIYAAAGLSDNFSSLVVKDAAHGNPPEMREASLQFLADSLGHSLPEAAPS